MSATPTTRAVTGPNEDHSADQPPGHRRALNFIKALADRDPAMPLGAILVLIYLYGNRDRPEGTNLRELRKDLGMTSTIASRSLYYWEETLISVQIDPKDRRGRT